jgi:hypothetical protein
MEDGETAIAEWNCAKPTGYWVKDDLRLSLPLFQLVPPKVATNVQWMVTSHRLVLRTLGRSRTDVGVLHIRYEWLAGLVADHYQYPAGNKPATLSLSAVYGQPGGRRFAVSLNPGLASDPRWESTLRELIAVIRGRGVTIGEPTRRTSDNGEKGVLTWDFRPVHGTGLAIPRHVIAT